MNKTNLTPQSNNGSKVGIVVLVLLILLLICLCVGVVFLWRKVPGLIAPIISWWQDLIFNIVFWALTYTHGNIVGAIGLVAFALWLITYPLNQIIALIAYYQPTTITGAAAFDAAGAAHTRLKQMFENDAEKIAFYENRLQGKEIKSRSDSNVFARSLMGCSVMLLWWLVTIPITLALGLTVYDGIIQVFVNQNKSIIDKFLTSSTLSSYSFSPLPESVHGIQLSERNLLLTALCGLLVLVTWYINSLSVTGWRRSPISLTYLLIFIALLAVSYLVLNGALLIFSSIYLCISMLASFLNKWLFPPIYFRSLWVLSRLQRKR